MLPGARAHDYGKMPAKQLFAAIASDGWKTVQLAPQKCIEGIDSVADITLENIRPVCESLEANHLAVGVYGCYVELAAAEEALRQKSLGEFLDGIEVAATVNAGCIGTETTNMEQQPPGTTRAEALGCLRRSLEQILPKAERLGVTVAVEPVFYHSMATPELTRDLLRDMKSKNLRVIFDPINLVGPELLQNLDDLWARAFDCFGEDIVAVHVKGARPEDGRMRSTSLADSAVDMAPVFQRLRALPGAAGLPVFREELKPPMAAADLAYIQGLFGG